MRAAFAETDFCIPPLEVIAEEAARARFDHFNILHHATALESLIVERDLTQLWDRAEQQRIKGSPE